MARLRRVFFDTSVLLGGTIDAGPGSRHAQVLMGILADGRVPQPRTAWHCCLEYYAVATRLPEELRLSPADTFRLLEEEVLARLEVVDLPAAARRSFLKAAASQRAAGGRLYDAHIAEIARLSGSEVIVTDNLRHFRSAAGDKPLILSSAELVDALTNG